MITRKSLLGCGMLVGLTGVSASAATAEQRSNYMGANWNGWATAANWAGVPAYGAEPGDGGGDINFIKMAHDNGFLYINFNQASQFAFDAGIQQIHFDTDMNAATGNTRDFWWHDQPTNVGAEHSMYGYAIWHHPDTVWSEDTVDTWLNYGPETGDLLIKINLAKLGIDISAPQSFNWVARMFGNDDFYPNTPDYHRYDVLANTASLNFNVPAGNFTTAASWSAAQVPTAADTTFVAGNRVATVNTAGAGAAHAYTLEVGNGSGNGSVVVEAGGELFVTNQTRLGIGGGGSSGTITQNGGSVHAGQGGPDNNLRIGFNAGSTGHYNLNGGDLRVADSLTIGHNGSGTFTMTGGSISRAGFITVGNNPGANGKFTMTGGSITNDFGDIEIGDEAPGNATIGGGTISTPGGGWRFSIGNRAAGTGVVLVNGTATINTDNFTVGKAGNGTATLDGNAVINARSSVTIGNDGGSVGNFTMNGGTIADDDDFLIGNFGNGTFTMNGGVISKAGWIVVGNNPGSNGKFNMNGGTINQSFGDLEVGDEAAGVLNQTGGTINVSGNILVSNRTGGVGDANVSGGLLTGQAMVNNGTFDASGNSTTTLGTNALGNNPGSGFIDGTGSMSVAGTAAVNAAHVRQTSLAMTGGTVKIADTGNGTGSGVSRLGNYTLTGEARFDLRDNKLITDKPAGTFTAGAYTGVQGDVAQAYNFGAWDTPGLTTSEENAGQNAGPLSGTTTIGVATAEQVLFIAPTETATFAGQTVTGATTIAMYTYAGDVNLDGLVDGADYGTLDNWIQFPGTSGYANGDVNYDGVIDGADYGVLDNTIQLQGAPFLGVSDSFASGASDGLSGVGAVPEPSAIGLAIAAVAYGLTTRRRRRRGDQRARRAARE